MATSFKKEKDVVSKWIGKEMDEEKKHSSIGKVSLILAISTILFVVIFMASVFLMPGNHTLISILLVLIIPLIFIFPILAIILGAIGYFGKNKDKYGLIGFILGILLIFSSIPISATTYVYVSGMIGGTVPVDTAPSIMCYADNNADELIITSVDSGAYWSNIQIKTDKEGLSINGYPVGTAWTVATNLGLSGMVNAGDSMLIAGTSGDVEVTMSHAPTYLLIGMWTVNI